MVSAWAQGNSLVLRQVRVDDKFNEITAIPKLLSRLDIAGAIVTIDAIPKALRGAGSGLSEQIAQQIIQQEGDYVLSLKGHQGYLHDDVTTYFTSPCRQSPHCKRWTGGHGRIETRTVRVTDDIAWLKERHTWPELQSIIAIAATRESENSVSVETHYFLSSLSCHVPKRVVPFFDRTSSLSPRQSCL